MRTRLPQAALYVFGGLFAGSFVTMLSMDRQLHDAVLERRAAKIDAENARAWHICWQGKYEMNARRTDEYFWRDNCQCKIIWMLEYRLAQADPAFARHRPYFVALDRNDLYEEHTPYELVDVWEMLGAPREQP